MIELLASAVMGDPVFADELHGVLDPGAIAAVEVQSECDYWIDPEDVGSTTIAAEMANYATVCWQLPMSELDALGAAIDEQFASARWSMSDAMGYTMVYHPEEPGGCLNNVAVSLMTGDAPADPARRVTAQTAVLLFMTPQSDLEDCG